MKAVTLSLLLSLAIGGLSQKSFASDSCQEIFAAKEAVAEKAVAVDADAQEELREASDKAYQESQSTAKSIIRWSWLRKTLRSYNGSIESFYITKERREKQNLNWLLIQGESPAIVENLSGLVSSTEASYEKAKYLDQAITKLNKEITDSGKSATKMQVDRIQKRTAERDRELGRFMTSFRSYEQKMELLLDTAASGEVQDANQGLHKMVLESMVMASEPVNTLAQTARDALSQLGSYKVSEEHQKFESMVKEYGISVPDSRPSLEEMDKFYDVQSGSNPARLARIRRQAVGELWTSIKRSLLAPQALQLAQRATVRLPSPLREMTSMLVASGYDQQMRDKHFENIQRVLRVEDDYSGDGRYKRLDELMDLDAQSRGEEFLVTFARVTKTIRTWDVLKAQVEDLAKSDTNATGKDSIRYGEFYRRMLNAEKTAAQLGAISILHNEAAVDRWARVLWTSGTLAWVSQHPHSLEFLGFGALTTVGVKKVIDTFSKPQSAEDILEILGKKNQKDNQG